MGLFCGLCLSQKHLVLRFGDDSIQVKADFAATVELKSAAMKTCEHSRQTNLFVALVQHSPGPAPVQPGAMHRQELLDVSAKFLSWFRRSSASSNMRHLAGFHEL